MDELGITDVRDYLKQMTEWAKDVEDCLGDVDTLLSDAYTEIERTLNYIVDDEIRETLDKSMELIREIGHRLEDI